VVLQISAMTTMGCRTSLHITAYPLQIVSVALQISAIIANYFKSLKIVVWSGVAPITANHCLSLHICATNKMRVALITAYHCISLHII